MTSSLPTFLTNFDSAVPQITLDTILNSDTGIHDVIIKSRISLNPVDRPSDSWITFQYEIVEDACLDTILYPESVDPLGLSTD